ncbi:hypothetical protein ACH5RR_016527 [Cinchona calisaya]|uniref:C2 NT-type domain-containing protein n=1 Tax=Cinchona calisaya TaxID=153742 RepID=A0ABD2ZWL5_9GENT
MVVKMMKWRPWPPLSTKKFEAKIIVNQLKGLKILPEKSMGLQDCYSRLAVEIKWKGSKGNALSSLGRTVRRNFTKEESLREDGVVEWNEEFQSVCSFAGYKDGVFYPWEVVFTVFNASNRGANDKVLLVAAASLNLVDFSSTAGEKDIEISIPLQISNSNIENNTLLCLSLRLLEMRTAQEPPEIIQRSIVCLPLSPRREVLSTEKDELSIQKTGLNKVNFLRGLSTRRAKKESREDEGSDGKSSVRSEDAECVYPLDTDSVDDWDEEGEQKEEKDSHIKKSFSYETLAYANHAGQLFYSSTSNSEDEDLIYYSHHNVDAGNLFHDNSITSASKSNQSYRSASMHRIFPWRKRKMSFKSSKAKGEPLLKKYYGDEGGDDIDYDRRQLSSSDESSFGLLKTEEDAITNRSSVSEFGDDSFAVGSWEEKEIFSRDGPMKLKTKVFFASIDQRSERAAGEGACTALVAVIADWFQRNCDQMPIKSQLDSLIREGSLEWRNLCENETYRERFPDKHFDLETVLQAKVRPLSVVPEKSFIGFFHPEGIEDGGLDFLQGAMSFDNIWDEISQSGTDCSTVAEPLVYIVSWNDHFFILKVQQDAYYIIDTLGERLFEGCNQAFILKFDRDTTIHQVPNETEQSDEKSAGDKMEQNDLKEVAVEGQIVVKNEEESDLVCKGKDSCKEYIKSFLAAIPLRELQVDIKKGLMASTPLHHRLQIEFHYTKCSQPVLDSDCMQAIAYAAEVLPLAA